MEHILLKNSFNYKKRQSLITPEGFRYDRNIGAWVSTLNKALLVKNINFPSIGTKKEDIETGEDQKGH
jgi:hypothetical protein